LLELAGAEEYDGKGTPRGDLLPHRVRKESLGEGGVPMRELGVLQAPIRVIRTVLHGVTGVDGYYRIIIVLVWLFGSKPKGGQNKMMAVVFGIVHETT